MNKKTRNISLMILAIVIVAVVAVIFLFRGNRDSLTEEERNALMQNLNQPFSAKADITLGNTVIVADMNRTNEGALSMYIAEPEALKDLSFSYDGKDIKVNFYNMEVNIADDSLVSQATAALIMKAVNATTSETGVSMQSKDGVLVIEGDMEEGKFSLYVDNDTGSLLKLSIPSLDLECNFSDFSFLGTGQEDIDEAS